MNELFLIESVKIGDVNINAINARELHERLHSKQDFSTWIKKRLDTCNAKEGEDYICYQKVFKSAPKNDRLAEFFTSVSAYQKAVQDVAQKEALQVAPQKNGAHIKGQEIRLFESLAHLHGFKQEKVVHNKKEYIISLELAKHIAMLEKNEIGRHIRQYFIDFENTHRESNNSLSIQGFLNIAKNQIAALEKTQANLEIVAQKVQILESTKRLEAWQEKALSDNVKAKVALLTKGRDIGTNIKSSYFRAIYKRLKARFYVARYSEIPSVKFDEAMSYVTSISQDDLIS